MQVELLGYAGYVPPPTAPCSRSYQESSMGYGSMHTGLVVVES
jgi:hypothetical protein